MEVAPEGLVAWFETFRTIQAAEVWASVGAWVTEVRPKLGPGVKERIAWAATVTPEMHAEASARRAEIVARMEQLIGPDDILCLPTSPRAAPLLGTPVDKIEIEYRNQAMCLLCIAGLAGLPQLSLPLAQIDGLPLGLSIVGRRGADTMLLSIAAGVAEGAIGDNRIAPICAFRLRPSQSGSGSRTAGRRPGMQALTTIGPIPGSSGCGTMRLGSLQGGPCYLTS